MYGDDHEYFLAIGSDSAAELHRWHRYEDLVDACTFAVVRRPGAPLGSELQLPPETVFVEGPMIDVSASQVRRRYAAQDSSTLRFLVPAKVDEFIIRKGCYAFN